MKNEFIKPDFTKFDLELNLVNGEVQIYGSRRGIEMLSDFCLELLSKNSSEHIHLGDYQVLTEKSLKGVIAIFPK